MRLHVSTHLLFLQRLQSRYDWKKSESHDFAKTHLMHRLAVDQLILNVQRQAPGQDSGADVTMRLELNMHNLCARQSR